MAELVYHFWPRFFYMVLTSKAIKLSSAGARVYNNNLPAVSIGSVRIDVHNSTELTNMSSIFHEHVAPTEPEFVISKDGAREIVFSIKTSVENELFFIYLVEYGWLKCAGLSVNCL